MRKRTAWLIWIVLLAIAATACSTAEPEDASTPTPVVITAEVTPEPTAAPKDADLYDYGRDRTSEYVYLHSTLYHEIDCPLIYGDMEGILLADALEQGVHFAVCCAELGKSAVCDFPMNEGFSRTMLVTRKIQMVSEGGDVVQDIVYVTTGDVDFDINSNFLNYTCRFFYKEFGIDPAQIKVYVRTNAKEYHNMQCDKVANTNDKYYLYLMNAYEQKFTACKTCSAPSTTYNTMPVKAIDDAHYYYTTPAYIRRVLRGDIPDLSMNIDVARMKEGYYDE